MRLLHPSPGEMCDRISILNLKIGSGVEKGINVDHFKEEEDGLLQALSIFISTLKPYTDYEGQFKELSGINKKLWKLEDEIRILLKQNDPIPFSEIVSTTREIVESNDRRGELVRSINALWNLNSGVEKLHYIDEAKRQKAE